MVKSPIEYFEEQTFDVSSKTVSLSPEEQRFLQKYVGFDYDAATLLPPPKPVEIVVSSYALQDQASTKSEARTDLWDTYLQETAQSLLMSFYLGRQLYALPALAVQEVIRAIEPTILPMASPAVLGVINFRSRVTPLIRISKLLAMQNQKNSSLDLKDDTIVKSEKNIIVCQCRGLQFGLLIEGVHTMHKASQESLIWDLASSFGVDTACIAALFVNESHIVPVLSLDSIVDSILYK